MFKKSISACICISMEKLMWGFALVPAITATRPHVNFYIIA